MKVLYAAAEGSPFAKVGGLGDVIGALPKSLAARGHEVAVVLPYYDQIAMRYGHEMTDVTHWTVRVGWRQEYAGVKKLSMGPVTFYFIDNEHYFFRGHVYGDWDDGERFAFFQQAVLEMMERVDFIPDVLHVNDYHTAMIPFLLKEKYRWIHAYEHIRTVLTIHNLQFQGQYDAGMLPELFGMGTERFDDGTVRWNGALNWLKAGILYADRITTVSPTYAREIMTPDFGCGLDQVLRMEEGKLSGITNGIDTELFDPATDIHIPYAFSVEQNRDGKVKNKKALQERCGLPVREDVPLFGIVSRLTDQKGFGLVVSELSSLLQQDIQLVVLGTGDPRYEEAFRWFADQYPDKVSAHITFNLELAQQIYAGTDGFLMPSAFEPCGLSQMMAMRYGSVPVVHEVGGLRDTVEPYNEFTQTGTGFGFGEFSGYWFTQTVLKFLEVYQDHPSEFEALQTRAMSADFSWDSACERYEQLYAQMSM
ncbi:starch synthase [Alloscardovia macacae]|uniref:Glycogen synthase n=1 Tax=Alloscardovia macacae TaxID=1160091 RepID=A0A1Y2SYU1_9BIFI|nr:glycogen synthase GlgA [Alloscardovia macacae]OTA27087.1 starch synthase [Alloscardovia macacae]OTA29721.1 starch synthase [Alloscardovia macacae]